MKHLNIKGKSAANQPLKGRPDISVFFQNTPCLIESLSVSGVDHLWVAGLTYIRIGKDWMCLAAVMDADSLEVIAWDLGNKKNVAFTLSIMQRAIARRKPPAGLFFYTDRVAEYDAYEFQGVLEMLGIRRSMNRPGKCAGNAKMESFRDSLKADLIYNKTIKSAAEIRRSLRHYID
jgi:putative transposase